jgi:hypothetical protein
MPIRKVRGASKYTLSNAHADGMLVKVRCQLCTITHRYRAGDLLAVCGDIPLWDIAGHFRCEKCQRKEFMSADWQNVRGEDLKALRVRRLVRQDGAGVRLGGWHALARELDPASGSQMA